MTKHIFTLLMLSVTMIAKSTQGQAKSYKIDTVLKQCLLKNESTQGMANCTQTALEDWDKELNKYYKLTLTKLDAPKQIFFRESQRQWLIYQDKELKFLVEAFGKDDGTMWGLYILDRKLDITRKRATEFIDYFETLDQH